MKFWLTVILIFLALCLAITLLGGDANDIMRIRTGRMPD